MPRFAKKSRRVRDRLGLEVANRPTRDGDMGQGPFLALRQAKSAKTANSRGLAVLAALATASPRNAGGFNSMPQPVVYPPRFRHN
jgi:hypothetical protein